MQGFRRGEQGLQAHRETAQKQVFAHIFYLKYGLVGGSAVGHASTFTDRCRRGELQAASDRLILMHDECRYNQDTIKVKKRFLESLSIV